MSLAKIVLQNLVPPPLWALFGQPDSRFLAMPWVWSKGEQIINMTGIHFNAWNYTFFSATYDYILKQNPNFSWMNEKLLSNQLSTKKNTLLLLKTASGNIAFCWDLSRKICNTILMHIFLRKFYFWSRFNVII